MTMEGIRSERRFKGSPDYEQLVYECQTDRARLERRVRELEALVKELKDENRALKAKIGGRDKALRIQDEAKVEPIRPAGKPLVL